MSNIFNSAFEVSLRMLLLLCEQPNQWYTCDMITAVDFIAVSSGEFGLSGSNLHGDNSYSFCEYAVRREMVQKALKSLVLKGVAKVSMQGDGFCYAINETGVEQSARLHSDYSNAYRQNIKQAFAYIELRTEREILGMISRRSVASLQRRASDD